MTTPSKDERKLILTATWSLSIPEGWTGESYLTYLTDLMENDPAHALQRIAAESITHTLLPYEYLPKAIEAKLEEPGLSDEDVISTNFEF